MLRSSSMMRSEKLQRRNCPTSMRMVSPSLKRRRRAHRRVANHDRPIGLDHFKSADAFVVIAENLEQHVAARPGRKENVVRLQQTRIVRNEIFRFGRLELEPAAHGASAPAQIDEIHLAVVVKDDLVFERRFHLLARFEFHAVENGVDIAQCMHAAL